MAKTRRKFTWRIPAWCVLGFLLQHAVGMAFAYLTFEHTLFVTARWLSTGQNAPSWWPGDPKQLWEAPGIRSIFSVQTAEPYTADAYLGPGRQPGVIVETPEGGVGIWRDRLPRRLHDSWGLVVPARLLETDIPGQSAHGWISLAVFENELQRMNADRENLSPNSVFRGHRYESLYALFQMGDEFTLSPPDWVTLPPTPGNGTAWMPPQEMYFSAAWGGPFRSVVEHAHYRWTGVGDPWEDADDERHEQCWDLLDYDGIPRAEWSPLFSAGIAWRPLLPGALLNSLIYACVLWAIVVGLRARVLGPLHRWRAQRRGMCPTCGYAIAAGGTTRAADQRVTCPECGDIASNEV